MSKIPKPTRKNTKGVPPSVESSFQTTNNLNKTNIKPMSFKVPAEFQKAFKQKALDEDISMVELLVRMFDKYNV